MLALFDIDGTLLEAPSEIHARALEDACLEVHDVAVRVRPVGADAHNGLTSPKLGRILLRDAGVETAVIDAAARAWRDAMTAAYLRRQKTTPEQRPFPDTRQALAALADRGVRIGLLTGNFRAIAEAKLRRAGAWDDRFDLGQGAFADDAEDRDELGRIARRRWNDAGDAGELIIVGDTPRDIVCARAAGGRAVALTTGGFTRDALADADVIADSLDEAVQLLLSVTPASPTRAPSRSR